VAPCSTGSIWAGESGAACQLKTGQYFRLLVVDEADGFDGFSSQQRSHPTIQRLPQVGRPIAAGWGGVQQLASVLQRTL